MGSMNRRPRAEIAPADWDAVVHSSPDGWVWALTSWLDMIGQVPHWALQDHSFAIEQDGRIAAIVPLHYVMAGGRLASSGWGWVGPVLAGGLHPRFEDKILKTAFAEMRAIAAQLGAERIEVAAPAVTRRSLANRWGVNPFTAHGFTDASTVTRVIDLRADEERLWADLSPDARQRVRRAREAGYGAAIEDWEPLVADYCRIHAETYARSDLPAHPREYFEGFARSIGPAGLSALMVGRDPAGRPVAFHNAVRFGTAAIYTTGCSETAHLASGVNYLLFWEAMIAAKRAGCCWYEAGDIAPASADAKIRGLATFKTKFGGEDHRYFRGALNVAAVMPTPALQAVPLPSRKQAVTQWRAATRTLVTSFLGPHRKQPLPPTKGTSDQGVDDAVASARAAYQNDDLYATDRICAEVNEQSREYTDRLLAMKLALVRHHYPGDLAVDLCCATGGHLMALAGHVERGIGIDFSARYVQRAQADATAGGHHHLHFACADAKRLPLPANCAGLIYSLSSLYAIPGVGEVFTEIRRVLRPGGVAILDLGNSRSLNTYCQRIGYKHWPMFPISVGQMRRLCLENKLDVLEHRSFQLLPLWAGKPDWLWPLLHPGWRRLFQRRVGGRMLDEWISSMPVLRAFAFRHLLVCRKVAA
jgi:SAM-dependent methyltransferase